MADTKTPSRNTTHGKNITAVPNALSVEGGMPSEGEGGGVGTLYPTTLVERPNKSINRNNGDDIARPSANSGMIPNGSISKATRKTGRV